METATCYSDRHTSFKKKGVGEGEEEGELARGGGGGGPHLHRRLRGGVTVNLTLEICSTFHNIQFFLSPKHEGSLFFFGHPEKFKKQNKKPGKSVETCAVQPAVTHCWRGGYCTLGQR